MITLAIGLYVVYLLVALVLGRAEDGRTGRALRTGAQDGRKMVPSPCTMAT